MKPYIAILIDSFWEAVGNKVLWALLIGWTLILLALAPFGYITERNFRFSSFDIAKRESLIEELAKGTKGQGGRDVQAIAKELEPDFVKELQAAAASDAPARRIRDRQLSEALNHVLTSTKLYSEEAFPTAARRKRLEPLLAQSAESLSPKNLEQLNRELLQLAFPLDLNRARGEQLWIGYAGFKLGDPLGIGRREISEFVEPLLLNFIIKLGLGVVAIFVALIVTSSVIPDTFRSSSLHLLLSKPISRVWLFLWKFFGGCIFVFVNITFVLVGLYLIAGLRFELWNNGLLACIPLLMFVFVIFYSVSALAGLLWGNAIVCVVTCMIFWLFCFSIGFMRDIMRPQVEVNQQVSRVREIGQHVLTVNEQGKVGVWNSTYSVWQPATESGLQGQARTFGPIYDPQQNLIVIKSFFRLPFGELQAPSRKVSVIRLSESSSKLDQPTSESEIAPAPAADETIETNESDAHTAAPAIEESAEPVAGEAESVESNQPTNLSDAREKSLWNSDPGPALPEQLFELLEMDRKLIAVCRAGIYQLSLDKLEMKEVEQASVFGIKIPWIAGNAFEKVTPSDFYLADNTSAAVLSNESGIVIASSGKLDVLKFSGDKFVVEHSLTLSEAGLEGGLEGDGTEASLVQMNDNFCVLARDGLPLAVLDANLKLVGSVSMPASSKARQIAWLPGTNKLAIVTHTGELLQVDCDSLSLVSLNIPYAGKLTSVSWLDADRGWFGVMPNQAHLINVSERKVEQSCVPKSTTFELIYSWFINPLYLVNPKPSALDNTMSYLLSGDKTMTTQLVTRDLEAAQIKLQIWQPIFSNLAFVAVIMGISCIYVARKEF